MSAKQASPESENETVVAQDGKGIESAEKMERIREIVFGSQIREYDQRFDNLGRDIQRLQEEVSHLTEQLSEQNQLLSERLQDENAQLTAQLQEQGAHFGQQLQEIDNRLGGQLRESSQRSSSQLQEVEQHHTSTCGAMGKPGPQFQDLILSV